MWLSTMMRMLVREAERLNKLCCGNVMLEPHERVNYLAYEFEPASLRDEFEDVLLAGFDEVLNLDTEEDIVDDSDQLVRFPIGTNVEVYSKDNVNFWRPAVVHSYDHGNYNVQYADGSEEDAVDKSRVRIPAKSSSDLVSDNTLRNYEMQMNILSEIIESEREYVLNLSHLCKYYLHVMKNPSHWGGQKETEETVFSQCTLNSDEAKMIFANVRRLKNFTSISLQILKKRLIQYTQIRV